MAEVSRVTAIWTGFPGAPGYSKFSFLPLADDAARNAAGAAVRSFFFAIQSDLPNGTTITVQPVVDNLDTVTGALLSTATMSSSPAAVVSSASATGYAGGSGYCLTWLTASVFNGRRVKGRTFLVPAAGVFGTDGTLTSTIPTAAKAAGDALIAAVGCDLAVWNRSWDDATPPNPTGGVVVAATGCIVRDAASQLRSRRS
jgi:hypothetical protein